MSTVNSSFTVVTAVAYEFNTKLVPQSSAIYRVMQSKWNFPE